MQLEAAAGAVPVPAVTGAALRIAPEAARALKFAHRHGVIHQR
jgi:hypothetical protein